MTKADFANWASVYYGLGVAWIASGFLPRPLGWLRHNMTLPVRIFYVVVMAAIYPLLLAKIILDLWRGKEETEL